jgi:DNA-binding Lrp family transcriptional regulator
MITRGYLLIETELGKTKEAVAAIRKLPGVVSVDVVTGSYDAIATIQVKSLDEVGELVMERIHAIDGVSRIVTCIAIGHT